MAKLTDAAKIIFPIGVDSVTFFTEGYEKEEINEIVDENTLLRQERNWKVFGNIDGSLAADSPISYAGMEKVNGQYSTLNIILNYQYREHEPIWQDQDIIVIEITEWEDGTYTPYKPENVYISDTERIDYVQHAFIDDTQKKETINGNETIIKGKIYEYIQYYAILIAPWDYLGEEGGWVNGEFDIKSYQFYTLPPIFKFENCVTGKQWKVEEGINSLITNIKEFQKYAYQWKYWKTQNLQFSSNVSVNQCPEWTNGKGQLSASQLNSIYAYVDITKSFEANKDKVSAAMFNDLATIINEGREKGD